MNLLQIIQAFAPRTGVVSVATVIGNASEQVQQLYALLCEVLEDLGDKSWVGLTQEALWTTVPTESQGTLDSLAPNGFKWIIPETLFNRSLRLPLFGPLSATQWQTLKALPSSGPLYQYRIFGDEFHLWPTPPAGETCVFEYASSFIVRNGLAPTTFLQYPQNDTDTFLVSSVILLAGLRWKWKYEKGLDYAEDFRRYEILVANALGRDGTKPRLNMGDSPSQMMPGILVPAGTWSVP